MAKGTNQKMKLIYLLKIMLEKTDEEHYITMPEILEALQAYGVSAERKSIYDDFEAIRMLDMFDIEGEQAGKGYHYHIVRRQFELPELKLLVDAIQSSKFITEKKSHELIKKLESLASEHEAKQLQRQVYVTGRIKTMNESIYYSVDEIHNAINQNKKIRFKYYNWDVNKEMQLRNHGEYFCVSPWGLSWDDENYYLIAVDSYDGIVKHYRVDKMLKTEIMEEQREGKEHFESFDMAVYTKKSFGMFNGKEETVKIEFENKFAGVVIDRFGKDIIFAKVDENHFTIQVKVAVSNQFFGWIFGLGAGVRVLGPDNVLKQMREEVKRLSEVYK